MATSTGIQAAEWTEPRPQRYARGRDRRKDVARASLAELPAAGDGRDPVAILQGQDTTRLTELVPIRYGRMLPTAFTFLRGAAAVMACDLAAAPNSGITVQLCGDAHLSNFGAFAAPDRQLVFDVNDFDETLPGPFEWDLKRLAASAVVAARDRGFEAVVGRGAALGAVKAYRERMAGYLDDSSMDIFYDRVSADAIIDRVRELSPKAAKKVEKQVAKARTRTSMQVFEKLTAVVDGRRQIVADPPVVIPLHEAERPVTTERLHNFFNSYFATLADDRQRLLRRFTLVDAAHKIVGVGSVGTRCLIALFQDGSGAPLFLQMKEAGRSVLEDHLPSSRYRNHGRRVVEGQRLMQAASDIFLGWANDRDSGIDFYFRQMRDMKVSADIATMQPEGFDLYATLCGHTLAHCHARSGDPAEITGYLGTGDRVDRAIADWAEAYADRTESDHALLVQAVEDGRVQAAVGV